MNPLGSNQHGQLPKPLAWDPYEFALFQQYSSSTSPWIASALGHASSVPVAGPRLTGSGHTNAAIKSEACETPRRQDEDGEVPDRTRPSEDGGQAGDAVLTT